MANIKNWQKGTGNYVVKELINPAPVEKITNAADREFSSSSGWNLINSVIEDGKLKINSLSNNIEVASKVIATFNINRWHKITLIVSSYVSGDLKYRLGSSGNITSPLGINSAKTYTFYHYTTSEGVFHSAFVSHINFVGEIDFQSVEELGTTLNTLQDLTTGTKFLENTTAGTAAIQSTTAYGCWEFDYNYSAAASFITFLSLDRTHSNNGYTILTGGSGAGNKITLRRYIGGSAAELMQMANNTLNLNTWYRMKVARLQSEGVFKDIPTKQEGGFGTNVTYPYDSFINNGRYRFSAVSNGTKTCLAGTLDSAFSVTNAEKYLVEFDLKLNSGQAPSILFRTAVSGGGAAISNTVVGAAGRNSIVLTITSTDSTAGLGVSNSTATDYEISGLTIRRIYPANTFAVFINGGAFGDNYTLVSTTGGTGTNPVTDATHTTSNYLVTSMGVGDRITNLKIIDGVDQ
jgi:hypothetical protein